MGRTKGAVSNKENWKLYLAQTDQTQNEAINMLLGRHMSWYHMLTETGLHPLQDKSKTFFKARALEEGWEYDMKTHAWIKIGGDE